MSLWASAKNSLQKLYNSIRRAWTELLQTCWINRFWQICSWYLADHACWDAPASVQSQFPEGCDRSQDMPRQECRNELKEIPSSVVLQCTPYISIPLAWFCKRHQGQMLSLPVSLQKPKCCLCGFQAWKYQQEINYFMLIETPTHHSRIVHAQHKRLHVFTILKNYLPHPRGLDWLRF